jgi:hypothetical protein
LKIESNRSVLPGIGVMMIGLMALGIATVEYVLFADITRSLGGEGELFGMSPGTAAYVVGYAGAGVALIGLGLVKILRARHGR